MKDAQLEFIKDGDTQIPIRPTNGCFDKNGKFIGVPEAGKEVDLADEPEVEAPQIAKGALHPATAE